VLKRDELSNPNSCLNRAKDDEMIFVLLAHDAAFAHAVREWAKKRVELGKNAPGDAQITEALKAAGEARPEHVGPKGFCGNPAHDELCALQITSLRVAHLERPDCSGWVP
jgi:hypothetical protein